MDTKSAARTLEIFEAFASAQKPLTLTELSKELRVPLSSCLNIVRTLERRGYLYSLGSRQGYYPSLRMLRHAQAITRHDPLLNMLGLRLEHLRDQTRETVLLAQRAEHQAVVLNVYDSPESIRYSIQIGELRPLHSTAIGKALLGATPPTERKQLLASMEMKRVTDTTLVERSVLAKELTAGEARGWHSSDAEHVPDLFAIAIHVRVGEHVFAVAVAGPSERMRRLLDRHVLALLTLKQELTDARRDRTRE
jgi:DNA-binding IclR family transcriptional regulator